MPARPTSLEEVDGSEVGCAILGDEVLTVGRVDEVALSGSFFDYTEKYTLQSSRIYMPARVERKTEERIQETAVAIYNDLPLYNLPLFSYRINSSQIQTQQFIQHFCKRQPDAFHHIGIAAMRSKSGNCIYFIKYNLTGG